MPTADELSAVYDADEYYTQLAPQFGASAADRVRRAVHEAFWGYPSTRSDAELALLRIGLRPLRGRGLPVPYPGDRPVLDIGCGNGQLLLELEAAGCTNLYGVEPTVGAADLARKWTNGRIHAGVLETADLPERYFYLVVMNQVLEHVPSPTATLAAVRKLIREDGMLYLTVPNFAAFEASLFGSHWSGLRIPAHLHHFTPGPLRALLERAGFHIVTWRTDTVLSITASSADDWGQAQSAAWKRWLGGIPRLVYAPLVSVADLLGRGQMLRLVAKCV